MPDRMCSEDRGGQRLNAFDNRSFHVVKYNLNVIFAKS